MLNANLKIIEKLKNFVHTVDTDPKLLEQFRTSPAHFTRSRKLPFSCLVIFICRLCKRTLSVELERFLSDINSPLQCSVSALCQQRSKLCGTFFYSWNNVLCYYFYLFYGNAVKRWKGFRVIAADGSTIPFVDTPDLRQYFGASSNQAKSYVVGRTFYLYDVLNQLILHAELGPCHHSEQRMAARQIDNLEHDMLMIYDRGFYSYRMIAMHSWKERAIKFVIRANNNYNQIKDFIASGQQSTIVKMAPGYDAIQQMSSLGYKVTAATTIEIRLVRVALKDKIEVLATNLWEHEGYDTNEFKQLYALRWGIETNIGLQKNLLQLESFSGRKIQTVLQDFYATLFTANLHSLLIKDGQQQLDKQSNQKKYPLKVNNNKAQGELRRKIVALFFDINPIEVLKQLTSYFIKSPLPVRKGRVFERVKKNKHAGKHRTFLNYKLAY